MTEAICPWNGPVVVFERQPSELLRDVLLLEIDTPRRPGALMQCRVLSLSS